MRKGSTSFGACEVRCWRWLFGHKIPISLHETASAELKSDTSNSKQRVSGLGVSDVHSIGPYGTTCPGIQAFIGGGELMAGSFSNVSNEGYRIFRTPNTSCHGLLVVARVSGHLECTSCVPTFLLYHTVEYGPCIRSQLASCN